MASLLATMQRMAGKTFPEPQAFRSGPLYGQIGWIFNDGVMLVRCDQSLEDVIKTVAHEARHIHDSQTYRAPRTDAEDAVAEQRARTYERHVWAQLAHSVAARS